MDVNGKTAIITAGGSGIGRAIAKKFHTAGARVCVCDIDDKALEETARVLPGVLVQKCDVSNSKDVEGLYATFANNHSTLDILVNNAGVSGPTKAVEDISDEEWLQTMNVNVNGMFYMVRQAATFFKTQKSGSIINLSSVAGRLGMPLRAPYSTSKYAVRGLTDVLAVELGEHNVRVNAILPGVVDGPRGRRVMEEQAAKRGMSYEDYLPSVLHNVSMHTLISMEEIADLAAFLGSDASRHITGQSISICGNFETYRAPQQA